MKKKLLALLLSAVLLLSLSGTALASAATLTVSAPDTLPAKGESFTVTVRISGNPGLCAAQYTLSYDKSVVRCESVKLGKVLSGALSAVNPAAASGAIVACAAAEPKTGDGVLSTYTFTVLSSGAPAFALRDGVFSDASGSSIATNLSAAPEKKQDTKTDTKPAVTPEEKTEPAETAEQGSVETAATETAARRFSDVSESFWGYAYIEKAAERGLFRGDADGCFSPNRSISRAEFVTVLWRSAGSPEPKGSAPFADVAAGSYYEKAVAWAKENGYVDGVSAEAFDPSGVLQRQAAAKILYCYAGAASGMETLLFAQYDKAFTDSAKIASWAKAPMYWAYYNGILSGMGGGALSPETPATRAQMAKILVSYLEQQENQ